MYTGYQYVVGDTTATKHSKKRDELYPRRRKTMLKVSITEEERMMKLMQKSKDKNSISGGWSSQPSLCIYRADTGE